jgi:flagellar motility protein MotE (MotC chaperone)
MNPSQPTPKSGPTLVRDVAPPVSFKTEIVNNIPVKSPIESIKYNNPQPTDNSKDQFPKSIVGDTVQNAEDEELDKILEDVNKHVKKAENSLEARFEHLSGVRKKVAIKKAKIVEAHNGNPPIMATIVASLVALVLSAAAVLAFK